MKLDIPQYTIRNMPRPVDKYLRQQAKKHGKSLNQTIIDELSERAGVTKNGKPQSTYESLKWFIGSGADLEVERILAEDDHQQKLITKREMEKLDEIAEL